MSAAAPFTHWTSVLICYQCSMHLEQHRVRSELTSCRCICAGFTQASKSQGHPLAWYHGPKPDLTAYAFPLCLSICPSRVVVQPEQLRAS